MNKDYRDGRANVITEIGVYIERELENVATRRGKIPHDTTDPILTHKRATYAGVCSALSRVRTLLNKKVTRMSKR